MALDHDTDRLSYHRAGEGHAASTLAAGPAEKAEMERRLRQSEDRFQALVGATGQIVWATPADGLVEDLPLWRAYTGQTRNDVRGWGWLDAIHPDDRPRVRAAWSDAVASGDLYEIDYRLRRSDGAYRKFRIRAMPVREPDGTVREWVGVHTDITERTRLENHQRRAARDAVERANQHQAIFEALVDAVTLYDADGQVVSANPAARELFGLGDRPSDYFLSPLADRVARLSPLDAEGHPMPAEQWPMVRVLRGEVFKGESAADVGMYRPDGRRVDLSISGTPIRDEDGHIVGAVGIARDVTERRRLDRRTHEALDALLEMAESLVRIPDESAPPAAQGSAAGEVTRRLAELTCRVLGCERVAIVTYDPATGKSQPGAVYGLSPEDEQRWWAAQEAAPPLRERPFPDLLRRLSAGEAVAADMRKPPFDAAPNPFGSRSVLAVPLLIGGQLVGILSLDHGSAEHEFTRDDIALAQAVGRLAALVIDRDRLLRQREEARSNALALERANRRMDEFLGVAGHELRTPLTSVKANLQIAIRRLRSAAGEVPEVAARLASLEQLVARAEHQTDLLNRLVGDLLDVSRIQAGKLELRKEHTDLAAVVRDGAQEQRVAAPARVIDLELPEGSVAVYADPDRIGQVLTNYLTNALKYSPEDAPVRVALHREGDTARVEVTDRGPGLPQEEQGRIWERFHRAPEVRVQSGSGVGLGLGLHISKSIVERHGGQVGVESRAGQGSTFSFTLPLAPAS